MNKVLHGDFSVDGHLEINNNGWQNTKVEVERHKLQVSLEVDMNNQRRLHNEDLEHVIKDKLIEGVTSTLVEQGLIQFNHIKNYHGYNQIFSASLYLAEEHHSSLFVDKTEFRHGDIVWTEDEIKNALNHFYAERLI